MSDDKGFLVDTSVLSAFAPGRPPVSRETAVWMQQQGDAMRLHVSVITVAEIQRGIRKLHRAGGVERSKDLAEWLRALIEDYGDGLLPVDATVARIAGDVEDAATSKGRHPGFADVLIAATAMAHGLVVLTDNVKHFAPLGVRCLNPVREPPEPDSSIPTP